MFVFCVLVRVYWSKCVSSFIGACVASFDMHSFLFQVLIVNVAYFFHNSHVVIEVCCSL